MVEDDEPQNAEEESTPPVELGAGESVEGAPLARVASRLTWPIERSEISRKEDGTVLRTPDGPRELSSVLDEVDTTYFATRTEFVEAVREVVGVGPVQAE